jgi:protein-tyrosine phosphatase
MAEAIARHLAPEGEYASAGLYALEGSPASAHAIDAADAMGGDASGHEARQLDSELAAWADRIYVMTHEHMATIRLRLPDATDRVELLDPSGAEVRDPYGADAATYLRVAGQIRASLEERIADW